MRGVSPPALAPSRSVGARPRLPPRVESRTPLESDRRPMSEPRRPLRGLARVAALVVTAFLPAGLVLSHPFPRVSWADDTAPATDEERQEQIERHTQKGWK